MKKNVMMLFTVLLMVVFIAACGSKSSSDSAPAASLAVKGTSGNAVNMNGTWKRCVHSATDQQDTLDTQTFNGGSVTLNTSIWNAPATANCAQTTTPDVLFAGTLTATLGAEDTAIWTNGSGSTSPPAGITANAKAVKVTAVFNSATATLNSDAFVNFFNSGALCGKTDWAKGAAVDVLHCTDILDATTQADYWVVDDSAAALKLYSQESGTAPYQVDSVNLFLK